MKLKPLFSEILRPRELADLALPQRDIEHLKQMVASKAIMNLLFWGKPGTGKTSTARVIGSALSSCTFFREMDGSLLIGAEFVRREIEPSSTCRTIYEEGRIWFLDQADLATKPAQKLLLKVIENSSSVGRYILAATDRSKLIPALRARLMTICSDVSEFRSDRRTSAAYGAVSKNVHRNGDTLRPEPGTGDRPLLLSGPSVHCQLSGFGIRYSGVCSATGF